MVLLAPLSCSRNFDAFLRNNSSDPCILDVTIRDKADWRRLPNQVRAASRVMRISSGIKSRFDTLFVVNWKNTSQLELVLPPASTVYLNDLLGSFMNMSPHVDCIAVIVQGEYRDTLLNGQRDFRYDRFSFTPIFFGPDALHYDVVVSATP